MLKGWAYVSLGRVDEGLALLEQNLAAIRDTGFPRYAFQLNVMADGARLAGDFDKARRAYEQVASRYPGSDAAEYSKQRISEFGE